MRAVKAITRSVIKPQPWQQGLLGQKLDGYSTFVRDMFSIIQKENPTDDSQAAELANFASSLVKVFLNDSSR